MKLGVPLFAMLLLLGCSEPLYKYPPPNERVYIHLDPAYGSEWLHDQDVYEDAFRVMRARKTNAEVGYLGNEARSDMFQRRNDELQTVNSVLLRAVRTELTARERAGEHRFRDLKFE